MTSEIKSKTKSKAADKSVRPTIGFPRKLFSPPTPRSRPRLDLRPISISPATAQIAGRRCCPWRSPHCAASRCAWPAALPIPRNFSRNSSSRHLSQPFQRGIDQPFPRLKFRRGGSRSFAVPGTDILADVAAKNLVTHARPQVLGDRAPLLDGQIRNAAIRIQLVGRDQRVGGTGIDAAGAAAAAVRRRQVRRKFERSQNDTQKQPRPQFLIDDAGVFSNPSDARVFGVHALDQWTRVHIAAGLQLMTSPTASRNCFSTIRSRASTAS